MGRFALLLLILALVAAFVGFGSLALAAGKILFIIFLILALIVYAGTFYTRPIDRRLLRYHSFMRKEEKLWLASTAARLRKTSTTPCTN